MTVTPVPEPSTIVFLLTIVALIVFPKTRVWGIAILAVGVVFAVLFVAIAAFWRTTTIYTPTISVVENVEIENGKPAKQSKAIAGEMEAIEEHNNILAAPEKTRPVKKKKNGPTKSAAKPAVKKDKAQPTAESSKTAHDWINSPPKIVGNAYQMAIVVGPYTTRQECDAELPNELRKALQHYAEEVCFRGPSVPHVVLPDEYLRQEVVKEQWEEPHQSSVGPMVRLHVLLRFNSKVKERILEERYRNVIAGRLWQGGVGLAAILGLVAVIFGYLKIDLSTAGAYRGRLRFAAILAILGLVAAALAVV